MLAPPIVKALKDINPTILRFVENFTYYTPATFSPVSLQHAIGYNVLEIVYRLIQEAF